LPVAHKISAAAKAFSPSIAAAFWRVDATHAASLHILSHPAAPEDCRRCSPRAATLLLA